MSYDPHLLPHELVTVQQHIMDRQREHPTASGEFSWLLSGITLATRIVSSYVNRAGLINVLGKTGDINVQGEEVQKLDMLANDTLLRCLGYRDNVAAVVSEENEEPVVIRQAGAASKYIVIFDPLDGSSNIDVNAPVGTIFGIIAKNPEAPADAPLTAHALQAGGRQLAAGYILYGSSTVLVYTTGRGVHMFTLDPMIGAYVLAAENVRMPRSGRVYSVNEGNMGDFPAGYQEYLRWVKTPQAGPYSSRYIGSLVADFHRTLLRGGVFLYPPTAKQPEGKLRLLFEANPLAFLAEQAGGQATDGRQAILAKQPRDIHERTPLVIGSEEEVRRVVGFVGKG